MPASGTADPIEPEAVKAHYIRALRISHLSRFAFFLVAGIFFAWAIPFMPHGLNARAYASATTLSLVLAFMAVSLAILSMVYFLLAARRREVLLAWSAVFDESTGLHNRQYFLDRLDLEIARANINNQSFRVFLLQARRQDGAGRYQRLSRDELAEIARTIRETLDANDTLAALRPDEFAVLAPSVLPTLVEHTEDRLKDALKHFVKGAQKRRGWKLRIGSVAFDGDVDDPVRLLDVSRRRLLAAPLLEIDDPAA